MFAWERKGNKRAHERMGVRVGAQVSEPEFYSCSGVGKGF